MGRLRAPVFSDGLRKQTQMKFYGYEALGTEGAIRSMENLTSDYWPELAVRPPRVTARTVQEPGGMAAGNELIWADGRDLHYGSAVVEGILESGTEHAFALLGDYVTVWPEKLWYDTVSGEHGSLGASVTAEGVTFMSAASPEELSDEANCMDMGQTVEGVIKPGDAVTISGCGTRPKNNMTVIVREVEGSKLYFYDNTFDLPTEQRYTVRGSDIGTPLGTTVIGFRDPFRPALETVFIFRIVGTLGEGSYFVCGQDEGAIPWPVITVVPKTGEPYQPEVSTADELTPVTEYLFRVEGSDIGTPLETTVVGFRDPSRPALTEVFTFSFTGTLPAGTVIQCTWEEGAIPFPVITITTPTEQWTAEVTTGEETPDMEITFEAETSGGEPDVMIEFAEALADYAEEDAVTAARTVPELEYVFGHENRLFGYAGDTIYASKWGDCFNWNVFDGIATDSWTTETGTPGRFTGGISYGGYVRLFKEDRIFILYGDDPSEYSLQSQAQIGIEAGSGRSLCAVNGRLIYLSPRGPCVYGGGTPYLIAEPFGVTKYRNGRAGTDGVKYYISMEDTEGARHLFVYDTNRGLWIREDSLAAQAMAHQGGKLWCLAEDGRMLLLGRTEELPEGAEREGGIGWMAEFGDITEKSPDRKRLVKLQIRLELEPDSWVRVSMLYDSAPAWICEASCIAEKEKKSVVLPVVPRRLDHFRLKIEGGGGCRISSISRQMAAGSDR